MTPSDENETILLLTTGYLYKGPASVRYPRGYGYGVSINKEVKSVEIGKANIKRLGKKIAILCFGVVLKPAIEVAQSIDATLVDMRFVKPLDTEVIKLLSHDHQLIVTIEDNVINGGAGSAVNELLHESSILIHVLNLGLPDKHIEHGSREELLTYYNLDSQGIKNNIMQKIKSITIPALDDTITEQQI